MSKKSATYLQMADLGLLMRFEETTSDSEGYDIKKEDVKRLANLGAIQSHGFGRYSLTEFGNFVLEYEFEQKSNLPLKTDEDRLEDHKQRMNVKEVV